jgi:hypothetical protein
LNMGVHQLFPKLLGLLYTKGSTKYNFFCAKTVVHNSGKIYNGTASLDFLSQFFYE